ncbi:ATP-binding protein [Pantanalinema rosaneae CENA516]|uniref:ATP-binding protein n=1 Tax=Pantanalinema rosaneae TaxID=1620701 RepID=UPI003D6E5152
MICVERIKGLLDSSSDLFQMISLDGRLLYTNQTWCQTLGYSATETQNRPLIELIHPTCRDRWCEIFEQVKQQQSDTAIQTTLLAKDGRTVAIAGQIYYHTDADDLTTLWSLWRIVSVEQPEIRFKFSPQAQGFAGIADSCTQLIRQYWQSSTSKYIHHALQSSLPLLAPLTYPASRQASSAAITFQPPNRVSSMQASQLLATMTLQEREHFLRRIYDVAETAIVVMEVLTKQDLYFVGCNPAYERLLGVTTTDIQGKRPEEVLSQPMAMAMRERYLACAAAQEQMTYEECLPLGGEETWWITRLTPLPTNPSGGTQIISSSTNITEHRRIEAALRSRNRQLLTLHRMSQIALSQQSQAEIFPTIVDMISVVTGFPIVTIELYDRDLQVMRFAGTKGIPFAKTDNAITVPANQLTSSMVIQTGQPAIHRYGITEVDACYLNTIFSQIGQIKTLICLPMTTNQLTFGVLSLAHPDQVEIDDSCLQWMTSLANYVALLIGQKQTELSLRAANQKTTQILESITDAFFILNHQWQFTYLNPQAEQLLQKNQPKLLEKCIWDVFPEAIDSLFYHQYHKAITEQVSVNFEAFHPHLNSWFEARAYPNGDGLSVYFRDVTVRKQAEAELLKHLEREKELNELKSRFVAMVSHEFRAPLTSIQTACELLEHYEWTALEKQERFQQVYDSIQYMAALLDDVIILSSIEADKLQFTPELLDLNGFCQRLVANYTVTARKSQHLVFMPSNQSRNSWIDPKLLRQILSNLLSNAIKYSPQGGTIRLILSYQGSNAIFLVQDEGIGIPLEDQKHLFEAFYRARNVATIEGTGLGMAIVKRCVELHHGEITVESQPGVGTTFIVTLPMNLIPEKFLN